MNKLLAKLKHQLKTVRDPHERETILQRIHYIQVEHLNKKSTTTKTNKS